MRIHFLIILFFSWLSFSVQAQFSSLNNKFTTNVVQGCAGMNVQVTYPGCGTTDFCVVKFGDGRPPRTFVSGDIINYPNPGNFKLAIIYSTTNTGNDSIPITVTPNNAPTFDVYSCNGSNVSVKVTESNYPFYIINYNDATAEVTRPVNAATDIHAYGGPPPNTRTVSVRGYNGTQTADNCAASNFIVDVYNVLPATNITQVEVLNSAQVKVDFNTVSSIQYRMMIGTNNATSFQQYKAIYNPATNSETVPSISPDNNFYCFRLDTYNPCSNSVVANSPVICSVNFDALAMNNQNLLTWSTAVQSGTHNYTDFTVRKEGVDLTPTIPPNQFSYTDTDVICNMDTSYQLVINYPGNVKSLSLTKTLTSFSTDIPTAVEDISASIVNNQVELTWIQDPAFTAKEYSIIKNGSRLTETSATNYTDTNYSSEAPPCYQISYEDVCLNESPTSLFACPITLTGDLNKENEITLTWSAYTGWQNGVSYYEVEKYNSEGVWLHTFTPGTALFQPDNVPDNDNQMFTYIVFGYANDGGPPVLSNMITIIKDANIHYPTAFTPGTTGHPDNNNFKIFGQYITSYEMRIYNRWGEELYYTNDKDDKGWDGTYKGNMMPEAAYVFKATMKDMVGRTFERSGSFILLNEK